MKTLLVPTDFSPNAQNALNYAFSLATTLNRKVMILSVYSVPSGQSGMLLNLKQKLKEDAQDKMAMLVEDLKANFAESGAEMPEIESVVVEGGIVETILDACNEFEITAIVMGTQGHSGVEGRLLGSNTSKVIERAKVPVLAVPEKAAFKGFGVVVYATEAFNKEDLKFMRLRSMMDAFNSEFHIINVQPPAKQDDPSLVKNAEAFEKEVGDERVHARVVFNESVDQGITDYAIKVNAAVIATVTHPRNFFQKLWDPSLTRKMALHAETSLLVFHES